ncbi:MazG nucleotide pyrophosphohydrolase domain-containing protein [Liquorilactobacillus oeni]|uniref:MazG nucleotide pyrophosphohydrolase domain-containing protein n=1 Tax=Liquorilactobacillus oeni TaxID=303241 RepID=UPI000710ED10|nr:MazG-like family protein [Liquorilactobacillus oeni]
MNIKNHQKWLVNFYKKRSWYQYSPFIRLNFLTEEVGELSRAVRALKIGRDHPGEKESSVEVLNANLKEELADVLDQVLIMSSKFDIDPQTLLEQSENKLKKRFHE